MTAVAIGLIVILALLALVFLPPLIEAITGEGNTRAFDVTEDGDRWRR
jgi:hypothetical protein